MCVCTTFNSVYIHPSHTPNLCMSYITTVYCTFMHKYYATRVRLIYIVQCNFNTLATLRAAPVQRIVRDKQPQRRRPTASRQKTRTARARSGGRWCCRLFGLTHIEPNLYRLHPSAKEPRVWLPRFLHAARAGVNTGPKDSQILRTCTNRYTPASG